MVKQLPQPLDDFDDDKPVGRVLSRREMLLLLGGSGAALLIGTGFKNLSFGQTGATATPAATALPACVVRPEMTEGPYFVDEQLKRIDVRIDPSDGSIKDGVPVHLLFNLSSITSNSCTPLAGAQIDIWSCDALGVYSGVEDAGFETLGQQWLRGYQVTDENGVAEFITIFPGWYAGRAPHIHFKIRTDPEAESGYEFTSQFFFDPALTEEIYTQAPYAANGSTPDTTNATDMHYANGGDQLLLDLTSVTASAMATAVATAVVAATATPQATVPAGYQVTFNIGLDLNDAEVGASDSFQMGGAGGGMGGQPPTGGMGGQPPSGGMGGQPPSRPTSTPAS